jgi:hypothetical protein
MPAKRDKRLLRSKKVKTKFKFIFLLTFLITLIVVLFFVLRTKEWSGEEKMTLVVNNDDLSVSIIVFDPVLGEIYQLIIPGDTEIEVAGGHGIWKIKSIWKLGEQEGLSGELLARSITMGLKLPVYAWADSDAIGLTEPGFPSSFKAIFSSYKSSLTFGDKLHMFIFSARVKNTKRVKLNLADTTFLERGTLSGGEDGYRVAETPPQIISTIFSEPALSNKVVRVSIKDATNKPGLAVNVGKVLEILGAKVTSVETTSDYDGVCLLKASDRKIMTIMLNVFDCDKTSDKPGGSFDLEITLGKNFAGSF